MLLVVAMLFLWPSLADAQQQSHSATRSFSSDAVTAGDTLTVTVEAAGYGVFGAVVETLPEGWTYVATDIVLEPTIRGRELIFTLLDVDVFTYDVEAPATVGPHVFAGILKNMDLAGVVVAARPWSRPRRHPRSPSGRCRTRLWHPAHHSP